MNLVVDANVIIKWFVAEEGSVETERLLDVSGLLLAPAHALAEVGEVLVRLRRKERLPEYAFDLARLSIPGSFLSISLDALFTEATEIALEARQSVYDALYVAAAIRWDTQVVTADERLVRALAPTRWSDRAVLLASWARRS